MATANAKCLATGSVLFVLLTSYYSTTASADVELRNGAILSDEPTWVVSYIEVDAASVDEAASLIHEQLQHINRSAGNLRGEALQRIGRKNHFVILEVWEDADARTKHASSKDNNTFRGALQEYLYAPYDERLHVGLEAIDPTAPSLADQDTVFVVTHADIVPPEQFAPCNRQVSADGPCGNELLITLAKTSRAHEGNLRFDVLTQASRTNHMTVIEVWGTADAQAAHQVHPDKKQFRDELAGVKAGSGVNSDPLFMLNTLTGSLWDERLYRLVQID